MIFYDLEIKYTRSGTSPQELPSEQETKRLGRRVLAQPRGWNGRVADMNDMFGTGCGLDGCVSAFIVSGTEGNIHMVASCKIGSVTFKQCREFICETLDMNEDIEDPKITDVKEIGVKDFESMVARAERMGLVTGIRRGMVLYRLGLDYFENQNFSVKEKCLTKRSTYKKAVRQADMILGDKSLYEELDRIYSDQNQKRFYGHPVHYKLSAGNVGAAMDIVNILVPALKKNGRLLGSRVVHVYDVEESCHDVHDMETLFETSRGNTVVIELAGVDGLHGNYASAYERVIEYLDSLVKKFGNDTLCIFIEDTEHPGFSQSLISKVQDTIDLIEVKEGSGDRKKAVDYFLSLLKRTDLPISEEEAKEIFPKKKQYSATQVYSAYQKWRGNSLKGKVYRAYQKVDPLYVPEVRASEPYKELQDMIGLTEVKSIVDQIIAMGKTTKMKSKMGMNTYKATMHMIFTGNPGSAKTTVARLIGQILYREGILDTGRYVECGRADLVARYVGWTAKEVRKKFREARGGILFIDEAYSLVDDAHSFGDEAINTIVQEMENFREDVIVIFAGYPEKMQDFLDKNEGLRSRIAFHLDFPDHTSSEMLDILHLMAEQKGYWLADGVDDKCKQIFEEAVKGQDHGNGRFARNLLEQAMIKQSQRVMCVDDGKKVTRKKLLELKAEDFEVNVAQRVKTKKQAIGF